MTHCLIYLFSFHVHFLFFFAATKLANSNLAHLHTVASSESRRAEMSATCQAHLLFGARRPSVQMRSGPFVAAEQHDWLLLFYSLRLCLVYARLCVFVWAHLQFALTSSKTELLSRILREVPQKQECVLEKEAGRVFFFFLFHIAPL